MTTQCVGFPGLRSRHRITHVLFDSPFSRTSPRLKQSHRFRICSIFDPVKILVLLFEELKRKMGEAKGETPGDDE